MERSPLACAHSACRATRAWKLEAEEGSQRSLIPWTDRQAEIHRQRQKYTHTHTHTHPHPHPQPQACPTDNETGTLLLSLDVCDACKHCVRSIETAMAAEEVLGKRGGGRGREGKRWCEWRCALTQSRVHSHTRSHAFTREKERRVCLFCFFFCSHLSVAKCKRALASCTVLRAFQTTHKPLR